MLLCVCCCFNATTATVAAATVSINTSANDCPPLQVTCKPLCVSNCVYGCLSFCVDFAHRQLLCCAYVCTLICIYIFNVFTGVCLSKQFQLALVVCTTVCYCCCFLAIGIFLVLPDQFQFQFQLCLTSACRWSVKQTHSIQSLFVLIILGHFTSLAYYFANLDPSEHFIAPIGLLQYIHTYKYFTPFKYAHKHLPTDIHISVTVRSSATGPAHFDA